MSNPLEDYEAQLEAMRAVVQVLKPLKVEAREAVLAWVDAQFDRKGAPLLARQAAATVTEVPVSKREGTVSMVAQKIDAKSARDLLLASAAHLTLFQGKDAFSKEELIACAKDARGWKSAYSNQMAVNIGRMIQAGVLFEKAKNLFSLSQSAETDLQSRLSA